MKNKTLRTNSMKLKKVIAASLAISVLFAFTGCGNSSTTDNTNTKQESSSTTDNTNTKQESSSTTETGSADELNEKRNDLYQQENQLFADHKDAWDKAFGLMNKNAAGDAMSENYADSLASTVESNKDSFSEEEYETLCKDIETIRGIEEEIAKLEKEIAASDSSDSSSSKSDESTAVFKGFKGKDLDGNDVDDSLFAKNKVTVVNFWFSGCKPCVGELSKLNELNEKLKEMGGEVVGINMDTLDNNEAGIKEAKEILKAQGASYKNLTFDSNSTVGKYAGNILISDQSKPTSAEAIKSLKKAGVSKTVMLTGDRRNVAEHVAKELGLTEYYAELLPADKVTSVEKLLAEQGSHDKLAFVGDGINDAPVLSRADIGIAMGAMGSDAAIEAADIVLMDDDPMKIVKAIKIARKCIRIVYENIYFAIGIKVICLILGALGIANMWAAIFADVGVMVIAVLNAIRALSVKKL